MTAPVLDDSASPTLPTILQGATNPAGITIADLVVDGSITDPDGPAVEAIAITGLNTSLGAWQYSLDSGTSWLTIQADQINSTTNELALLLGPTAMVRLLLFGDLNGTLNDAITFRAWDQSSGNEGQYVVIANTGGTTAFSEGSDIAGIADVSANKAPSFALKNGAGETTWGSGENTAHSILLEPDGRIIVASSGSWQLGLPSQFSLASFNANATPDTGFNRTGRVSSTLGDNSDDYLCGAAGLSIAGGTHSSTVVRYNTDGSLDTSFDGTGIASLPVGALSSVAIQLDGRILIGGGANGSFSVARFSADGSLDTSFDGTGEVSTPMGEATSSAHALAVQADGKILAAGNTAGWLADFAVVRYNADGSLDTSFNGTGKVLTDVGNLSLDYATGVALQPDGKIIVCGGSDTALAVVRYNPDGSLDTTFNGTGKVLTDLAGNLGGYSSATSVATQSDGKIVAVGITKHQNDAFAFVALVRYNPDGTLDTTFNGTGSLVTDYGSSASCVQIQTDGKIVVAGEVGELGQWLTLARYNSDGSVDTTFGVTSTLGGNVLYGKGARRQWHWTPTLRSTMPIWPHWQVVPAITPARASR